MNSNSVEVIPTVSWSTEDSYDFCFSGIPERSVVALSSVGIRGHDAQRGYLDGVEEMLERLRPRQILVYGRSLGEDKMFHADFKYFKTRWEE